jgi:Flp pilus assembly protein TadG
VLRNLPLIRDWRRAVRDSNGAAALIFAFALPVMLGFAGLAIEVGSWFLSQRAMQGVADTAAISAATALSLNSVSSPAFPCTAGGTNICTNEALSVAAMNGWTNGNGVTIVVHNPPTSGQYAGNNSAVQVVMTKTGTNWFSTFLPTSYAAPTLGASSVALVQPGIDCMLSLDQGNTTGIAFVTLGIPLVGPGINMPNCSIGDNSTSLLALTWVGDVPVNAYSATVVGGIFPPPLLNVGFNWTRTPVSGPIPPGPPTPDPYACPGAQCRTMPAPTLPDWLDPPAATAVPSSCTGPTITTSGAIPTGCSQGIVASGNMVLSAAACTRRSPCIIMSQPAINVTGGTLTINGGGRGGRGGGGSGLTILGVSGAPAISVSGASSNVTINTTTNIIQGGPSGGSGISVSGGSLTINATTDTILGGAGSGGSGISVSGRGSVTINASTNTIQGGAGSAAINLSGSQPSLTFGSSSNDIIAGAGSSAIVVDAGSDGNFGQLTFGNGNDNIQGAQTDGGNFSAMTIGGFVNVAFGSGTTVFGGPQVQRGVPAVDDHALFGAGTQQGLTLGSGSYTFMEGIRIAGGDLMLNRSGRSFGYYIMVGGGFDMTLGHLTGTDVTIALTGGAAGNIDSSDYANFNYNGASGITLTAPTTGPTAGIAIFQDRAATSRNANTFFGNTSGNITGAIYTPNQPINFLGIGLMNSRCLQMIASHITIAGIIYMNDDCDGTGTAPISGHGSIVLVQ